jgi:hypothetical protein
VIADNQLRVTQFECDICHRRWINLQRIVLIPLRCPSCRSREWNGKKQATQSHKNEIKLPSWRGRGRPKVRVPDLPGDDKT